MGSLPRIYAQNRSSRPGTIDRPDVWWRGLRLRTESRSGPWYVAIHGAAGIETGFVRYRPIDTEKWFVSDQRTVVVEDFFAPTIEAYLGLLRFLLGLDLLTAWCFGCCRSTIRCPGCCVDRRAVKVRAMHDETWLRLSMRDGIDGSGDTRETAPSSSRSTTHCAEEFGHVTITGDGAELTARRPDVA